MDSSNLLHFVDVPVIQSNVSASLGVVLGDIESRMPKGHQYSAQDKVTWAHETTHGINNSVRNANRKSSARNSRADALLKYANKNEVAYMADLALLADKQKTGIFAAIRRFAA